MTEAELALERAKKLAFLMTERFSMNPISAKLLNEAWRLAFPDEVAVARRMRALVEALEKAQQAININNQWKPDVCPITGRRFFLWIEHPELGYVPTYGGPYDSYTIPTRDSDGEFSCERYDHDFGGWVDGECVGAYLIDDDEQCRVYELEQRIAELESRTVKLPDDAEHDIMAPVAAYLSEKFKWDGGAARWDGRKEYDVLADRVKYALRMVIRRAAGIKWEAE
ncbi:hypothetical protein [Klebsiella michiganensis]|uniref:hypothetical protein n=1 Tax=Klebsiella michiganensis TaxID=1134687 RepID=UPI001D0DFFF0|nr:hypothetical protein [Klebsiella michiganensis]